MAKPAPQADEPGTPQASNFPTWVAVGSLAAAMLVFFGSTVPALRERDGLRADRQALQDLRLRYETAIAHLKPGTPADEDWQSLLVAIDRLSWTPAELLRHYPEPRPLAGAPDTPPDTPPDDGEQGTGR